MLSFFVLAANTPGVYYAFANSDGMGKFIVVLLFVGSIFTWSVMIDKGVALRRATAQSDLFVANFRTVQSSDVTSLLETAPEDAPVPEVYRAAAEKVRQFYHESNGVALTEAQKNAIESVLEREISSQIFKLESGMNFLATMVSVSPFFGLFGTVWGVMLAFCAMAQQGSADIAAMAPGIGGALLTTVVGLLVAVPSLIGYNLLGGTIRKLTINMDNFSEEFMVRLKLEDLNRNSNSSR